MTAAPCSRSHVASSSIVASSPLDRKVAHGSRPSAPHSIVRHRSRMEDGRRLQHLGRLDPAVGVAQCTEALRPRNRTGEPGLARLLVRAQRHRVHSEERDIDDRQIRLRHVPVDDADELVALRKVFQAPKSPWQTTSPARSGRSPATERRVPDRIRARRRGTDATCVRAA